MKTTPVEHDVDHKLHIKIIPHISNVLSTSLRFRT